MKHKHFPFFLNIENKKILIVGGGNVAFRRVLTLTKFDFDIKIVTLDTKKEMIDLCKKNNINIEIREFCTKDLEDIFILLMCTDDDIFNKKITKIAKENQILVSNCSDKDDCDFFFPAIHIKNELILGMVGDGNNHKAVAHTMKSIRVFLEEE